MSFRDCINGNNLLSKAQKKEILNKYDKLQKKYQGSMGELDAARLAAEKVAQAEANRLAKKKIDTLRDVVVWKTKILPELKDSAAFFASEKAKNKLGGMLYSTPEFHAVIRKLETAYSRSASTSREYEVMLGDLIDKYASKLGGFKQDVDGMGRVFDELLGSDTGDAQAKAAAKALREVFDLVHSRYRKAGGYIGKIDNWTPQAHNPVRVAKASFDEWSSFIRDRVDLNKMVDVDTGLPMTSERLDELLPEIYETIRTNGLNEIAEKVKKGAQIIRGVKGGIAERRALARFFYFKDAKAFKEYNAEFGFGDAGLFDATMGHISAMSRDIALLEEMGPKPDAIFNRMNLLMESKGASAKGRGLANAAWNVLAGRTSFDGKPDTFYQISENLQNWLRSTLLGGAPISAMADSFYGVVAAKANGLPATDFLKYYAKLLNPLNISDRRVADRQVVISSAVMGVSLKQARQADGTGKNIFSFMAGATNRLSGLGVMTDANKQAIVLSAAGYLSELSHSAAKFDDLADEFKSAFARWGMGEDDFSKMMQVRGSTIFNGSKADFLMPEDLARAGHVETARKYGAWLSNMTLQSSNEPGLLTRAIVTGGMRKGTVGRAVLGNVMMFKSFGISVMINHLLPSLRLAGQGKFGRISAILMVAPFLGMMSIQSRNIMYGKEPQEINAKTFKAGLLQSGGFGILGDFLFADYSRFQQHPAITLMGPAVGMVADLSRVFLGNFDRALDDGEETKFFADMFQFAERNIPVAKLWYTRLLMERLILDQMERAIDPKFDRRIRKIENKMKKQTGNEYWWRPGDISP